MPSFHILSFLAHLAATLIELQIGALGLLLFPEHGWAVRVDFTVLLFLGLVELALGLLVFSHLLVKDIKVSEVRLLERVLLLAELPLHPLLPGELLRGHRGLRLHRRETLPLPEFLLQVRWRTETCGDLLLRLRLLLLSILLGWGLSLTSSSRTRRGTILVQIDASLLGDDAWPWLSLFFSSITSRFHY